MIEAELCRVGLDDEIEHPAFAHTEGLGQRANECRRVPIQNGNRHLIHEVCAEWRGSRPLDGNPNVFVFFHDFGN